MTQGCLNIWIDEITPCLHKLLEVYSYEWNDTDNTEIS